MVVRCTLSCDKHSRRHNDDTINGYHVCIHLLCHHCACPGGAAGKGVDVNARHPLGWGALHVAAINGRREAVGALLRAGADPNLPEEYVNIYNTAREKGMHSLGALF